MAKKNRNNNEPVKTRERLISGFLNGTLPGKLVQQKLTWFYYMFLS